MDKHWTLQIFIVGLVFSILFLCETCLGERVSIYQDAVKIADKFELPVQTHQDAIEIANMFTGFKELPNFSDVVITVQQVVVEEDNTLLFEWIEGRSFWKISYTDVVLEKDDDRSPYIDAFDVFVDVESGKVAKIVSHWKQGIDPKYKEAKRKMGVYTKHEFAREEKKGRETKVRVPELLPKISFLEAYKKLRIDPGVKHIEVIYLYDSEIRDGRKVLVPKWDFDCYGGEALNLPQPEVTIGKEPKTKEYLTVMKEFRIDVITGEEGEVSGGRI